MTELLPRPFCGGTARLGKWVSGHSPPEETWLVQCGALGCYARVGTTEEDQADAIAAWNTRATTPTASELVEALRKCRQTLAMMVEPGAITGSTITHAYASAVEAISAADRALSNIGEA